MNQNLDLISKINQAYESFDKLLARSLIQGALKEADYDFHQLPENIFGVVYEAEDFDGLNEISKLLTQNGKTYGYYLAHFALREMGRVEEAREASRIGCEKDEYTCFPIYADYLFSEGRTDMALDLLVQSMESGDTKSRLQLGVKLAQLEKFEESVETLKPLADSGNFEAIHELTLSYIALKEYKQAYSQIHSLALKEPVNPRYLFTLANIEKELGDFKSYLDHLQLAGTLDFVPALRILGFHFKASKDWKTSKSHFERAAKLGDAVSLAELGFNYYFDGDTNQAEYYLNEGRKLGADVFYTVMLGEIFKENQKYEEALAVFREAISTQGISEKDKAQALSGIGSIKVSQKNYVEASQFLSKAIGLGNTDAIYWFGELLYQTKDYVKAIDFLLKSDTENNINAMTALMLSYAGLSDYENSKMWAERAGHAGSKVACNWLADILTSEGKVKTAQFWREKAMKI